MTPDQEKNVLDWVEAMLSGTYKHGTGYLYNPSTNCYCGLGVAAATVGVQYAHGVYIFSEKYSHNKAVPDDWFSETFGLHRSASTYAAINDHSKNFFALCALLLNAVPVSRRMAQLRDKMHKQVEFFNSEKVNA